MGHTQALFLPVRYVSFIRDSRFENTLKQKSKNDQNIQTKIEWEHDMHCKNVLLSCI